MLIFKTNIHDKKEVSRFTLYPPSGEQTDFLPEKYVENSINEDLELIACVEKQPPEYWDGDLQRFYPYAYKIGGPHVIRKILLVLLEGMKCKTYWYQMNTYHFCVIYDCMFRHAYNYNHDSWEERIKVYPEFDGQLIRFDLFVKDYFFNTIFLMDPDKYNSLSGEEKELKGFVDPCQFGMINGLLPEPAEIKLQRTKDFPYTINV